MIHIVLNRAVAKNQQSSAFDNAVKRALHKRVLWPHIMYTIPTQNIDDPAFTVPVAAFIRKEIEQSSVVQAK